MKIYILVNLAADHGQAASKWQSIENNVLNHCPQNCPVEIIKIQAQQNFPLTELAAQLQSSEEKSVLLVAGGDGTLNLLLNYFSQEHWQQHLRWGAIGLGHHNFFHVATPKKIRGIPCLVNFQQLSTRRMGKVNYSDNHGQEVVRVFHSQVHVGVLRPLAVSVSLGLLWQICRHWQAHIFSLKVQTSTLPVENFHLLDFCVSNNGSYIASDRLAIPAAMAQDFFHGFFWPRKPDQSSLTLLSELWRIYRRQFIKVVGGNNFVLDSWGQLDITIDGEKIRGKRLVVEHELFVRNFLS